MSRPEISGKPPNRVQITMWEDRYGDHYIEIQHQPSGRSLKTRIERKSRCPFFGDQQALGGFLRYVEYETWRPEVDDAYQREVSPDLARAVDQAMHKPEGADE